MLSDEELIDGLRSELATLHPRSDLIDRLRERAAADQPHDLPTRRPRRPRWLPSVGAVVAMASVLVAVVVGGSAVVLLGGHRRSAQSTATTGTQATPADRN